MVKVEKVGSSFICYYSLPDIHIREYYNYCLSLLKEKLISSPLLEINLIFGKIKYTFENHFKTIHCDIQIEHTLVKEEGRGVKYKIFGKVKTDENKNYLVRIVDLEYFDNLDFIIDYSLPNILNVSESGKFFNISSKIIHISPTITEVNFEKKNKISVISTFSENGSERRQNFQKKIKNKILDYNNITNKFSKDELDNIFFESKILVNVHQTDHHHTFEELRVLPALCRGVIIVSEDVPLKEKIPYHEFIIWSNYDELINKIKEVTENYNFYYEKIFNEKLKEKIIEMLKTNKKNLDILNRWEKK